MQESIFWEYIDLINQVDKEGLNTREKEYYQVHLIKRKLINQDFSKTLAFHRIFSDKIYELFLPTLAEVFMASWNVYESLQEENLYISNDGFRDFRSWIVGLGKKEFENFKQYSTEKEFLNYDLDPNKAYREDLEYIIVELYEAISKREKENSQIEIIYKKKYEYGYDGDYDKDLINKIDWANIDKKYPTILRKK